jgi:hypothetical protein
MKSSLCVLILAVLATAASSLLPCTERATPTDLRNPENEYDRQSSSREPFANAHFETQL